MSSPDGSDILFLAPLARKRYSGRQEIATNYYDIVFIECSYIVNYENKFKNCITLLACF